MRQPDTKITGKSEKPQKILYNGAKPKLYI